MLKKLRLKFVCIVMALVAAMLCVIFALVVQFTADNLEAESLAMLRSVAGAPYSVNVPNETVGGVRLPYFTLQMDLLGNLSVVGESYYDLSDTSFLAELIQRVLDADAESGIISDYHLRFYMTSTRAAQYIVFADMSSEIATLKSLRETCALIGGACFVALLAISLLLARWAVKPVEAAWRQQRQFVADASHELKTPLTVITTNAELLEGEAYDAQQCAQFSENILTMSRRMRQLGESLLQLARADNEQNGQSFAELDYSKLVSDALLPFEPLYFEKGLRLTSELEDGIHVRGSGSHLRQVAEILLDNAQKYCAAQSEIAVRLRRHGKGHCLLSVAVFGEPIAPEELKKIFGRFYRLDEARTGGGGYGLGLSIAP